MLLVYRLLAQIQNSNSQIIFPFYHPIAGIFTAKVPEVTTHDQSDQQMS